MDETWADDLDITESKTLIVMEGLVMYLTESRRSKTFPTSWSFWKNVEKFERKTEEKAA